MKKSLWSVFYDALIVGGIALRFHKLATRDLWLDEREQLSAVTISYKRLLVDYLPMIPGGFPGDYLLTAPLAHISVNKWTIGIPHILVMLLTFWVFARLLSEERLAVAAKTAAMVGFVFNQNLIFHSLEFRPYAVLPLLALSNYYVVKRRFDTADQPVSAGALSQWILLTVVTVLFHAYGLIMVGCVWLYQAAVHRPSSLTLTQWKRVVLPPACTLLAITPIWLHFSTKNTVLVRTFEFCGPTLTDILKFVVGNLGDLSLHRFWICPLLVIVSGFFVKDKDYSQRFVFLFFMIVLPISVIFAADLHSHYWFIQRQFVWVMPFYALLLGKSVQAWLHILGNRRPSAS